MNYIIVGFREDGTLTELFRSGNCAEATLAFSVTKKWSYKTISLVKELETK